MFAISLVKLIFIQWPGWAAVNLFLGLNLLIGICTQWSRDGGRAQPARWSPGQPPCIGVLLVFSTYLDHASCYPVSSWVPRVVKLTVCLSPSLPFPRFKIHAQLTGFSPEADWSVIVNAEVQVFGLGRWTQRSCMFNKMLYMVKVPHALRTQAEGTHDCIIGSD